MIEQILEADRYLQVDQVEKARAMYGKVVELDPGNAIAVVGLARCALADGNDPGAHELASRALGIDPQNDMARRMEARLSEVLATRGETVERPAAASEPGPAEMRPVVTQDALAEDDPATDTSAIEGAPGADEPAALRSPTPEVTPAPEPAPTPAPTPAPPPAPRRTTTPSTPPRKERPMRKSLFDRLMGR